MPISTLRAQREIFGREGYKPTAVFPEIQVFEDVWPLNGVPAYEERSIIVFSLHRGIPFTEIYTYRVVESPQFKTQMKGLAQHMKDELFETIMRTDTEVLEREETETKDEEIFSLILWNDDVTDFIHVIESVCRICQYEAERAEQCAMIAHEKGKYAIKTGSEKEMTDLHKVFIQTTSITTSVE